MMGVEEPKELSSAVLNFPKDIPFQYDYEVDTFYVRPCYARYYEYITNKFAETGYTRKRGVTVTGTPGIGKSMFMAYFFLRYRFEHQHENPTIIMTSYNTSSILEEIVLWKDGLKSEEFYYDLPHLKKLYHEYPNALVLLDGPPAVAPRN
ncbi:hypothetical protein Poli38472_000668 [Pythium oligandrum]|uniref:Uncharacterized protein n=1 Tax=Pythium oligandrum TaxID=41045 RepID=A0A8K1CCY3_PYTOL|nr:hypothetical protein Poli38472_000668 [Pythium oligandrum]|eukprot:TMW60626.1 hypothetical protein Poli38472_000668 [Pythium oligandrum]